MFAHAIAKAPAGADDEQARRALRGYSAISAIKWMREYAGSTTTTTRATESRLGGWRQGCRNVSWLLHLIVLGHKAKSLSSATDNFPPKKRKNHSSLFRFLLTGFPAPCIIESVFLSGVASDERGKCLRKGIAVMLHRFTSRACCCYRPVVTLAVEQPRGIAERIRFKMRP